MIWLGLLYVAGAFVTAWVIAQQAQATFWGVLACLLIGLSWPLYLASNIVFWAYGELLTAANGD